MKDVNILDLSRIFTGPFCAQILSDLGANIIKVEPPGGDDTRNWGPPFINQNMSSYFAALNRNKKTIELNLKTKDDQEILKNLVKWTDVVIENYRPGVVERLNIDFDTLIKINPKLIYLTITGYGGDGPYRDHPSYDIIAQSESGMMSITGTEDGQITKPGVPLGDISAGLHGAIGILAALHKVKQTGEGIKIDTDLFGSLTSWLTYQSMNTYFLDEPTKPMGTAHPNIVPYQSFQCKDKKWISIAVGNEKLWECFVEIMEIPALKEAKFASNALRIENREELVSLLQTEFKRFPTSTWYQLFNEYGIPVGKINNIAEVHNHPQIKFTGQKKMLTIDDTVFPVIITPIKFSTEEVTDIDAPPKRDQDRTKILEELNS